jgi:hypothetical protein
LTTPSTQAECEHQGPHQVGHPPPAWRAALDQMTAGKYDGQDADREVDQEHEPPAGDRHESTAQRGPEPSCRSRHRREQGYTVGALIRREGVQHQRQRGGHQESGAEGLQDPEGDQHRHRWCDGAQDRSQREQLESEDEDTPASEQVGDLPGRDQEGREDDVVEVQNPGQRRDRRARERALHVREGDVDDRRVDEGHARPQRGDRQDRPRRRTAAGAGAIRLVWRCGGVGGQERPGHLSEPAR